MSKYKAGPIKRCVCLRDLRREGDAYYEFVCLKIYECQEVRRRRQNKKKSGKSRNRSRVDVTHYIRVYLDGRHAMKFVPFEIAEFKAYFQIVKGSHRELLRKGHIDQAFGPPKPIADIQRETVSKKSK